MSVKMSVVKILGGFALMAADFLGSVAIITILPAIGSGDSGGEPGAISLLMAAVISLGMSSLQISLFHRVSHREGNGGIMGALTSLTNFSLTAAAILLNVLANYLFYNVSGVSPEQIVGEMAVRWQEMKAAGSFGYIFQAAKFALALIVSFLGERLVLEGLIEGEYLESSVQQLATRVTLAREAG